MSANKELSKLLCDIRKRNLLGVDAPTEDLANYKVKITDSNNKACYLVDVADYGKILLDAVYWVEVKYIIAAIYGAVVEEELSEMKQLHVRHIVNIEVIKC